LNLSIIIPFKKEKDNLDILVPELIRVLDDIFKNPKNNYEILLIGEISEKESVLMLLTTFRNKNLFFVTSSDPDCYGNAIRTGIEKSRGDKIITMDSDYSHDPKYIKDLYKEKDSAEVILASRYIKNGLNKDSFINIMISKFLNLLIKIIFNLKISDITSSFRIYDAKLLKSIETNCDDFDIIEEILIKLLYKYKKLKILEIPFCFKGRKYGNSKRKFMKLIRNFIWLFIKLKKIHFSKSF